MMISRATFSVLAAVTTMAMASPAVATPISLYYSVTSGGAGVYDYDFALKLDNHDGSWKPGQNFNWIVFGDKPGPGVVSPLADFSGNPSFLPIGPFTNYSSSSGGHNGPSLFDTSAVSGGLIDINEPTSGWIPTTVGQTLVWSGTSSHDLKQGQLLYSDIIGTGVQANFDVATEVSISPIPLPGAWSMFAVALLGLMGLGSRARQARLSL